MRLILQVWWYPGYDTRGLCVYVSRGCSPALLGRRSINCMSTCMTYLGITIQPATGSCYSHWQLCPMVYDKWPCANSHFSIFAERIDEIMLHTRGLGYSSSSRAGRLGQIPWPQNSTSVAETEKKGGVSKFYNDPNARKEGSIFYIFYMKSLKKGGQKSTILKNIGVKILQLLGVLKEGGQKPMILKKYLWEGDQNSTTPCGKRAKERVNTGRW